MKDESLSGYFSDTPGWKRQLAMLRKKSLAGYHNGSIRLSDATAEECGAAERLLGRHFAPPRLRYTISDFEKALRASRFAVIDMADFWERMDGTPLRTHPQQKAARQAELHAFFAAEAQLPHERATLDWLCAMERQKSCGFQILQHHIGKEKDAAQWLHWVCCALDRRQRHPEPEELALCSYAVSTNPHALDAKTEAGKLLLYALAYWQQTQIPAQARQKRAFLRRCGLMQDDISNFIVQRGLILAVKDGREQGACAQLRREGRFCLLTSSQLDEIEAASSPTGRAYVLENRMLFSSLCRKAGLRHPLVCTSGQFKEASWQLLDLLAKTGCQLYYAGDFDPEGLGIADRLWKEYGDAVHFWHMEPEDYQKAISHVKIAEPDRLRQLEHISCPLLRPAARAILREKRAGYQEALAEQYLADLRATPGEN